MGISNIKFKALDDSTSSSQPSTADAVTLKKKLNSALDQIKEAEKYDQYLSMSEKAELEKSQALLMADVQAIDYFLKTGEWLGPSLPSEILTGDQLFDINSVGSGWYVSQNGKLTQPAVSENGEIYLDNTAFMDANGEINKPKLWFIMDEETGDIKAENKGNDLKVTVGDKTWTIVGGAIRTDIGIGVNALKSQKDVTMDFSHMMIVDQKTGEKGGVYIIGSKNNDTIYGSAGIDEINGVGGNDIIEGGDGDDNIYGYASSGDTDKDNVIDGILDYYGEKTLGIDGSDTIYDIYGTDINPDGGPGWDTVYRGTTNGVIAPALGEEAGEPEFPPSSPSDVESFGWFSKIPSADWHIDYSGEKEIILERKNSGSKPTEINMDLMAEEGFMITGSKDGTTNDLILTAAKVEDGIPIYYRIRVRNYFSSENDMAKLTIANEFVDLGNIDVGTKTVNLIGTDNDGDILVGPKTILDTYGLLSTDLGTSTYDDTSLKDLLKTWMEDDSNSDTVWHTPDINNGIVTVNAEGKTSIDIPPELGAVAFVERDETTNTLTITVVSNTNLNSQRVVIEVTDAAEDIDITLGGEHSAVHNIAINSNPGVTIDGGAGVDFLAGYRFGMTVSDSSGDVGNAIKYKPALHSPGPSTAKTFDELLADIGEAVTFDILDTYQITADQFTDEEQKTELQEAINEKRNALLTTAIGYLTTLNEDYANAEEKDKQTKKDALQEQIDAIDAQIKILQAKNKTLGDERNDEFEKALDEIKVDKITKKVS